MKRFRLKTKVEPAPPPFSIGTDRIVPYAGIAGRVVRRYFYKCSYYYDVRFANDALVRYHHDQLRLIVDTDFDRTLAR